MGVLTGAQRSATIQCAGEVELLRVESADFIRIVDMTAYDAALNKYIAGDFLAAESAFNAIPGPLPAYMRRRCGQLQVEQGKFWPGYYSWEVK